MVKCPLTNSFEVKIVEQIATKKIITLYNQLGVDTKPMFGPIETVFKYRSTQSGYCFYYPFTLQGDSKLYEKLEQLEWYYQPDKWEHQKALELIDARHELLEIGCGSGDFLVSVKNKFNTNPIGLELNEHVVKKALALGLNVQTIDVANFAPDNRERFHTICLFQVLEHISDPLNFIQQLLPMLKPSGQLIICVPNNDALFRWDHENPFNLPPHHMGLWNEQSLKFLGKQLGLKISQLEKEPLQAYHIDWYSRTLLKRLFGSKLYYKILSKTKIPDWVASIVKVIANKINGHSIMVVFQK